MLLNLAENDVVLIAGAYALGSIPFGLIIAWISGKGDIRKKGSGNIGATNVMRVGGKILAVLTLLLDAGKGAFAVLVAREYANTGNLNIVILLSGAAVIIGHVFPIWLRFKGGKGVATTFAVLTAIYWPLGAFSLSIWLITFFLTKISSLAAILSMIATPTLALYYADILGYGVVYLSFFIAILVIVRHHSNINRLVQGEEGKII